MTNNTQLAVNSPKPSPELFKPKPAPIPVQAKAIVFARTETSKPSASVLGVEMGRREILLDLTPHDLTALGPWATKHLSEDVPSDASSEKCKNVGIALKQARELIKKRSSKSKKVNLTEIETVPSQKKPKKPGKTPAQIAAAKAKKSAASKAIDPKIANGGKAEKKGGKK